MFSEKNIMISIGLKSLLVSATLWAQNSPPPVYISPTSGTPSEEAALDSGRYTVKTPTNRTAPVPKRPVKKEEVEVVNPDPTVSRPLEQATSLQSVAPQNPNWDYARDEKGVGTQVRDLVVGGSGEDVARYRGLLNPEDSRLNHVELEIAPMFVYNESQSDYVYRAYNSATPGGRVGLAVWLTPFFGVQSNYAKTFVGTIKKESAGASTTPFLDQWLQIGLRFRRHSNYSLLSPSLTFGVDYSEYQKKVPSDDVGRVRISTTGLLLNLESRLPTSESYAWNIRLEFMPMATHREYPTGLALKSGDRVETLNFGVAVGGEFSVSRSGRMFWKIRNVYEKNSFTGFANKPNPSTGEFTENVSVVNNFVFFELGYNWGY